MGLAAGLPPSHLPPGVSPEPSDTGRSLAGVSLLLIEDHPVVLEMLRRLLTAEGADIETATTGEEGLRLARNRAYDVIVLDLKLPRMSGVEVLQALRHGGVWTPVLILTGFPSVGSAFEAGRLGAVKYLQKPAPNAEVVAAIRLAMEGRPLQRRSGGRLFRPSGQGRSDAAGQLIARLDQDAEVFASLADIAPLLVQLLAEPDLTLFEFISGTRALRRILGEVHEPLAAVVAEMRAGVAQAEVHDAREFDPVVGRALFEIEAAGSEWSHLDEESVARLAGLPAASVWPLVEAEVGLGFVMCRRVFVMRRAVLDLAHGHEQVKQVAVRAGYEHVPNFNRDFQESFALPPTEFRRLFGPLPAL